MPRLSPRPLFEAIRAKDVEGLRPTISLRRIDLPGKPGTGGLADAYLDSRQVPVVLKLDGKLSFEEIRVVATAGLDHLVEQNLPR